MKGQSYFKRTLDIKKYLIFFQIRISTAGQEYFVLVKLVGFNSSSQRNPLIFYSLTYQNRVATNTAFFIDGFH